MRYKNVVYIKVTNDKYRFITAMADSVQELAQICGVSPHSISSEMCHAKKYGYKGIYERVELEEDDGE